MPRPVLNLARRPFVNRRPVRRAALLVAICAGLVLLADGVLYGRYLLDSRAQRGRLAELDGELNTARGRMNNLLMSSEFQELAPYNTRVTHLNTLIAERTFPWGRLFDRLSELMPAGVRAHRLNPVIERDRRGAGAATGSVAGRPVELSIDGVARTSDDLLAFLDALFAAPDFVNPVLEQESQGGGGERSFAVKVRFLTRPEAAPADGAAGATRPTVENRAAAGETEEGRT